MKLEDIIKITHNMPKIVIVLVAIKNITISFMGDDKCYYPKGTEFELLPDDDHYLNSSVRTDDGFCWGTKAIPFSKLKFKEYKIIK